MQVEKIGSNNISSNAFGRSVSRIDTITKKDIAVFNENIDLLETMNHLGLINKGAFNNANYNVAKRAEYFKEQEELAFQQMEAAKLKKDLDNSIPNIMKHIMDPSFTHTVQDRAEQSMYGGKYFYNRQYIFITEPTIDKTLALLAQKGDASHLEQLIEIRNAQNSYKHFNDEQEKYRKAHNIEYYEGNDTNGETHIAYWIYNLKDELDATIAKIQKRL